MNEKDIYFPYFEEINNPGFKSKIYKTGETLIMVNEVYPRARIPVHNHEEAQIGLVLKGKLEITVGDETKELNALDDCYYAKPFQDHSAYNPSDESIITIDIKRKIDIDEENPATFMSLENKKVWKNGLSVEFFVGDWFEIMKSVIPDGGEMPAHSHSNEQIGICYKGTYQMEVGNIINEDYSFGKVYYTPPNVEHYAINNSGSEAQSFNIFIPKRYNKKKKNV